jgi:hypothetical protein
MGGSLPDIPAESASRNLIATRNWLEPALPERLLDLGRTIMSRGGLTNPGGVGIDIQRGRVTHPLYAAAIAALRCPAGCLPA